MMRQVRPRTSPITFITSATFFLSAPFVDDGERRVVGQLLGEKSRPLDSPCIRTHYGEVRQIEIPEITDQHRTGKQMIDRNIEEALNLRGVEIDEEGAIGAGGRQKIRDELRTDGNAGPVFAVLPGVAVVGHHNGDARGGRPLERVHHDQELYQMLVNREACGLDQKNIRTAHIFQKLEENLTVGEPLELGFTQRYSNKFADLFRKGLVGLA